MEFYNTFLIKIVKEKTATNTKIRKLEKAKVQYYSDEKIHQHPGKSWKIKISIRFLFRTLIGRSSHKHQDPGKSWKNQNFNTFLIRILIEKSSHKHQDPAKSWKNQNFNTFLIRILKEKAAANTKILPKAGKIKISILF